MEQVIMVLVFALAAALCLRVFAFADRMSARNAAIDRAVIVCQTAAEVLKTQGGDMAHAQFAAAELLGGRVEQGMWYVLYNEDWEEVADWTDAAYSLHAQGVPTDVEGLWRAEIWVDSCGDSEEILFSIPVAWQEVNGNG
jgi:hypothetical protein